jgi:hypothetical protein
MDRLSIELASQVGIWVPIFVVFFILFFVPKAAQKQPYLKRVAKKYSIRPFDLR